MSPQDRDRLVAGWIIALVVHGLLVLGLSFADLSYADYPEVTPVLVELPEYLPAPSASPEEPRPTEPEEAEPEPEPPEPEPEPEPPPEPEPQEIGSRSTPEQQPAPAPVPQEAPRREVEPQPEPEPEPEERAPSEEDFDAYDLRTAESASPRTRETLRTSDESLFSFSEPDAGDPDAPEWVSSLDSTTPGAEVEAESTMNVSDREELRDRYQSVPGFEDRLREVIRGLEDPDARAAETPPRDSGDGETSVDRPGDTDLPGEITWVGDGRGLVHEPVLPGLTAAHFGGRVPAQVTYIIVFDVDATGLVLPTSLLFRQSSGYTAADREVAAAVRQWQFEPARGAPMATAILTLRLQRGDLQ